MTPKECVERFKEGTHPGIIADYMEEQGLPENHVALMRVWGCWLKRRRADAANWEDYHIKRVDGKDPRLTLFQSGSRPGWYLGGAKRWELGLNEKLPHPLESTFETPCDLAHRIMEELEQLGHAYRYWRLSTTGVIDD